MAWGFVDSILVVGRILGDDDLNSATGRATVEARLNAGIAVTPLGLGQPPSFQALYGQSSESLFGRSATLLCPHERLRIGPLQIMSMNDERSWIVAHSSRDPLDLPSSLLEVLCYFDGRPTEDALKTIAAEHGIKLDASLIRKLTDFEVLVSTNES